MFLFVDVNWCFYVVLNYFVVKELFCVKNFVCLVVICYVFRSFVLRLVDEFKFVILFFGFKSLIRLDIVGELGIMN